MSTPSPIVSEPRPHFADNTLAETENGSAGPDGDTGS
jgi:hypothetical protein